MYDLLFIIAIAGFFGIAYGYLRFCENLHRSEDKK